MAAARPTAPRRYGGLEPHERRAVRRGRLVDAGLALYATDGFRSTTIEGLCATAGVTPRHFYEQFATKDELLAAVFDRVFDAARVAVANALEGLDDDPELRMRVGLSAFLHSYLDDPRHARIACIEVVGVSPVLERLRRAALREFADLVALQARDLGIDVVDPLHSLALVGGTNELVIEWLVMPPEERPTIERLTDALVTLYLAAWRAGVTGS